jgi:hypothetical protein
LSSGKKSDVGDSAASLGSSHRIQSSNVPKLKPFSILIFGLVSSLGKLYELWGKTSESGDVGDDTESQESELARA